MKRIIVVIVLVLSLFSLSAKDIYVREGSNGDGSKNNPYGLVWIALFRAVPGDVIHISEGHYYGRESAGIFTINQSDITLSGGYNSDFTERDPFKYFTIFEQTENYNGEFKVSPVLSADGYLKDFSNLIIDGIIFNCENRNKYNQNGGLLLHECVQSYVLYFDYVTDVKIRNCIFLNSSWGNINLKIHGNDNEIINCFFLNSFHNSIYLSEFNDTFKINIKNNTIGFVWNHPYLNYYVEANGLGIRLDDNGDSVVENNIILYTQSFGILNTNNPQNVLIDNIFYQCQEGIYKYLDMYNLSSSSVLLWEKEELELLNLYPDLYHLMIAEGNIYENPVLDIDIFYLSNLVNYWTNNSSSIAPELLDEWRRNEVYLTDLDNSTEDSIFGMAYKLEDIIPNLLYNGPAGVQVDIEFPVYDSGPGK